ncbi:sh2d4a [Pungitius sinensis]
MLQQILKDMFIDPDVLDALNEDQKKTLFVKMRQEQVRRWTEREEKLEREAVDGECKRTTPKKANSKNVSWLLGRDGDVAVVVIGELDELNSKFIHSGFGEKKAQSLQNNACDQTILKSRTTEPVKAERENTQPGISLNLKGKREETSPALPLPVSVSEHSSPTAAEKPESKSASATEEESASWRPISTRLLRTPNPVDARPPPSANPAPASVNPRLCLANLRTATAAPTPSPRGTAKTDSAAAGGGPHSQGPQKSPAHHSGKDVAASEAPRRAVPAGAGSSLSSSSGGGAPTCAGRGRVAQLMKTFSTESAAAQTQPVAAPRGVKPPLPNKPGHLRLKTTPTVR